jgi:hypothetical protein
MIPIIFQNLLEFGQGAITVVQASQISLPPNFPGFAQGGEKQVLFALEVIVKSALGSAGGFQDVTDGSAHKPFAGKLAQGLMNNPVFQ